MVRDVIDLQKVKEKRIVLQTGKTILSFAVKKPSSVK